MKAGVEITSGIVRTGPDYAEFGDDFDFAVAFTADSGKAKLKALVNEDRRLVRGHVAAVVTAMQSLGLEVEWDRVQRRSQPASDKGLNIRRVKMSHGPSVNHGADANGNHTQHNVKATASAALADPSLHFEPVTEYAGAFKGREGEFKTFHVSKA